MIIILCIIARGWLLSGRWTRLGNANREMLSTNANWSSKYLISLHIDIIFFLYGNIIHSKWYVFSQARYFHFSVMYWDLLHSQRKSRDAKMCATQILWRLSYLYVLMKSICFLLGIFRILWSFISNEGSNKIFF